MREEAVRLNRLYDAYAEKGFVMIVISPHDVSDLRTELIEQYKAKYWIGCDARLQTLIEYVVPNVMAEFPMTYLVDSRGTIVDHGDKLEGKIEYLLQEIFDPKLGRDLHAALAPARKDYDAGSIGSAWAAAGLQLESEDAQLAADAKFLREKSEAYAAWVQLMLERKIAARALPEAVRELKRMEKSFGGMTTAAWAATTRADLEKDPKVKMESILGVAFEPKLDRDLHAGLKSARRYYDKGSMGAAWKAAGAKLEEEDVRLVEDAQYLRERCEAYGEWHRYDLQRELDSGEFPAVVAGLKKLAKTCKGMPTAAWASQTRRNLEKDPKVKIELKAWARLERALAKQEKAAGRPKKLRPVLKEFRAIQAAYPDTLAAREAGRQLAR